MEFSDFMTMRNGWDEKMRIEQAIFRKHAFIIAASNGAKWGALENSWPDPFKHLTKKEKKTYKYKGVDMSERQIQLLAEKNKNRHQKGNEEKKE